MIFFRIYLDIYYLVSRLGHVPMCLESITSGQGLMICVRALKVVDRMTSEGAGRTTFFILLVMCVLSVPIK